MAERSRMISIDHRIWEAAAARGKARGVSAKLTIRLTLAAAFDLMAETLAGPGLSRLEPELKIKDPLGLLTRALNVPLRPDGVYGLHELLGLLDIDRMMGRRWVRKGWLPTIRSRSDSFMDVFGADVLHLLLEQSDIHVRGVQAAMGGVELRERGRDPGPEEG